MARFVRVLCWMFLVAAVVGLAAQHHVVIGTMFWIGRWPLMVLAFLAGGYAFGIGLPRAALQSLVVMAIIFGHAVYERMNRERPISDDSGVARPEKRLGVLSYNVLAEGGNPDMTLEAMRVKPADVLLLQEVTPQWRTRLERDVARTYAHRIYRGSNAYGLAIFSRHPVGDVQAVADSKGPFAMCGHLTVSGRAIALCNVHLTAPDARLSDPLKGALVFGDNARVRVAHWEALEAHLQKASAGLPRIIGGDFNTLEWEPLHQRIRAGHVDCWREQRFGLGATYPNMTGEAPFPIVRLDYVFTRGLFAPSGVEVVPLTGSDHRALFCAVPV